MRILAVDSSAVSASCGIYDDKTVKSEFYMNIGLTHSQTLMPMVDAAIKYSSIDLDSVDYFAVSYGPGSFTGIRIGVAAVKGMAFAKNKKCIGISTLEAIAYNFCGYMDNVIICSSMDARRQQVYNALFELNNGKVNRITEDRAISIENLKNELAQYNKKIILAGDGAVLCYESCKDLYNVALSPTNLRYQRSYGVALAAYEKLINDENIAIDSDKLVPVYLRPSQAERELKLKKDK